MASVTESTKEEVLTETGKIVESARMPKEVPQGAPWNFVEDALLRRRSVRKYKKKQVPEHYIRRILEVARFAPSQGNCQPWRFIVVRDREMIDEMEEYGRKMMQMMVSAPPAPDAPELHPVPTRLFAQGPKGGALGVFHGAPTIIFPVLDMRGIGHPEIDLGIVGSNIIMAACSLGLGTCWVGLAELLNTGDWPARLGIQEPYQLIEGITIGYPVGDPQMNFVQRETHKTTWIESGGKREIY